MATIKDVAREAGVSIATVSRVINESAVVSAKTRRRVRDVAGRLNYWPNGVARSLITHRTHTLGVMLPELHGEFFSSVIRGVDRAARQQRQHLLVSSSHADTDELLAALRAMHGRIDGLIVMAPDMDAQALRKSAGTTPAVLLDAGSDVEGYDTLSIANFDGARAVVRHLMSLGHRRIATITGPERNVDARERLGGYRAALADGGGDTAPEAVVRGDFTERSGYEAACALLRLPTRPTAFFAGNDYMALGAFRALADAGLRVPEDVAVVGFDDIEMARYLNPPLTTVRVDADHLGERAVGMLLDAVNAAAPRECRHEMVRTTPIIRRSCGAPPMEQTARPPRPGGNRTRHDVGSIGGTEP